MASDRTLMVKFTGESSGLDKASKSAEKSLGGFSGALSNTGSAVAGFMGGIAGGLAVKGVEMIASGVKDFVGGSLEAASDLKESANVVSLVWGDAAQSMDGFFASSATTLGMSRAAAQQAAAGVGGLLQNMHFSNTESAQWSQTLMKLSADMGSAFNADPAEAIAAIGAGLRGEAEPLKRFNVFLSDAAVQAEAAAMGLVKGKGPLDEHTKAQARLSLIMKQTSAVQGDFANTSDGAANASRVQAAKIEDLKAKIGQGLLPVQEAWLGFMNNSLLPALSGMFGWMEEIGRGFTAFGAAFAKADGDITSAGFPGFMEEAANIIRPIFDNLASGWTVFSAGVQSGYTSYIQPAVNNLMQRFAQARDTIMPIVTTISNFVLEKWAQWGPTIQMYLGQVAQIIGTVMNAISGIIGFVLGVIQAAWDFFGTYIMNAVSIVFDTIMGIIGGALDYIQGLVDFWIGVFTGNWDQAWSGITQMVDGAWQIVTSIFSGAWDYIKNIVGAGIDWMMSGFRGLNDGISNIFRGIGDFISGVFEGIIDVIKMPISAVINWINDWVIDPVNGVSELVGISIPRLPSFHAGGLIPGHHEVPILALGGEGVLSRRGMTALGGEGVLNALNAGNVVDLASITDRNPTSADFDRLAEILAEIFGEHDPTSPLDVVIDEGDIRRIVRRELARGGRR